MPDHFAILAMRPNVILVEIQPIADGGIRATFKDLDADKEFTVESVDKVVIDGWYRMSGRNG